MMRPALKHLLLVVLVLVASSSSWGGEIRFHPSFGISEEFTDNIYESPSRRKGEVETTVQPGGIVTYDSRAWALKAAYNFVYRNYARGSSEDEFTHTVEFQGAFNVVENLLRLDLSEVYLRVPLDVARDTRSESSFFRQVDQNTFVASPYLLLRWSDRGNVKTGVRYSNISYSGKAGIDREEIGGFAQLTEELSPLVTLTAGYVFNRTGTDQLDYRDHNISAGLRYGYGDDAFIFGTLGNSWQLYSDGSTQSNLMWDAGASNRFDTLVVTMESHARYIQDPLVLSQRERSSGIKIAKMLKRSNLALAVSYNDYRAKDAGVPHRTGVTVTLSGDRQLSSRLTAFAALAGDRLSSTSGSLNYPYRVAATLALNYLFGADWRGGFAYTYVTYRDRLGNANGSVDVNRMIFQLRKQF